MNAIILIGENASKKDSIKDYIKKNDIPSYNIFEYQDPLKIVDVRDIKRILASTALMGKARIFIFYSDPTVEAQNALLKTLEELAEDTTIVFAGAQELLSTTASRCRIVKLKPGDVEAEDDGELRVLVDRLSRNQNVIPSIFRFSENVFSKKEKSLEETELLLRKLMLESIEAQDEDRIRTALAILKKINRYNVTLLSNNLNKRLLFERVLISEFAPDKD